MAHLTINHHRFELTVPDLDNDALRAALAPIIASFREQGGVWLNTNVEDAGAQMRWIPASASVVATFDGPELPADMKALTVNKPETAGH